MRKSPVELVVTAVETLVAVLTARTAAATTTAPEGLSTWPWIAARESWGRGEEGKREGGDEELRDLHGGILYHEGRGWWGKIGVGEDCPDED